MEREVSEVTREAGASPDGDARGTGAASSGKGAGERLVRIDPARVTVGAGSPRPLGATPTSDGVNFAIVSGQARTMTLGLFEANRHEPSVEIALDPDVNRTGAVWHVFVSGVGLGARYAFRVESMAAFGDSVRVPRAGKRRPRKAGPSSLPASAGALPEASTAAPPSEGSEAPPAPGSAGSVPSVSPAPPAAPAPGAAPISGATSGVSSDSAPAPVSRTDGSETSTSVVKPYLVDPYARAIAGAPTWNEPHRREGQPVETVGVYEPRGIVVSDAYAWRGDAPLATPMGETIICELHVRGFTRHPSAGVTHAGTYRGLEEKIAYLKELGVTAVELLPIHEFNERENPRRHPRTKAPLVNYWGYSTVGFFAPKSSYAASARDGEQIDEFRRMVRSFHEAGIEVYLDVVYNHTAEGNERGPTMSFKGLDPQTYYIIDPRTGLYHNYSGCGNTVNCNHPVVQDLILDSLRYWVTEMHVDGFRFDLASILCRGGDGAVLKGPPVVARISADPVLSGAKLIAEAWDAAGLYQVGDFPHYGRWAEWNGKFRDDVRRFVKGDAGFVEALASRLTGSPDLYEAAGRRPTDSVNFVTAHDGFTLLDLVSYNEKHNLDNGEDGKDGCNENHSWNCGHEGPTNASDIRELRVRQAKNLLTLLFVSHGTPMFLGGDEMGRTQGGNNNPYCHDDETTWVDWTPNSVSVEIERFTKELIALRRRTRLFRPERFTRDRRGNLNGVAWHGVRLRQPDWSYESRSLAAEYRDDETQERYFLIANAHCDGLIFELPALEGGKRWWRILDTAQPWPRDIARPGSEIPLFDSKKYRALARSTVLLVAR